MPWPLLKWIMYSSSESSSSSDDDDEEIDDVKDEGISKVGNDDIHRVTNKQGGGKNDDTHNEDDEDVDVSYVPQEEETSNSSDYTFTINEPRRKPRRIDTNDDLATPLKVFKRRKRVWSKEDELELLKNFLDHKMRPKTVNETSSFYDEVNPKFKEHFDKRKLAEKLGRLKKKYRNHVNKMTNNSGQEFRFRNPDDKSIFEISHRIWAEYTLCNIQDNNVVVGSHHDVGSSKTTPSTTLMNGGDIDEGKNDVRGLVIGLAMNPIPLSLRNYGGSRGGDVVDEKWKEQQILELEAYSKRLELVQHQVEAALDDLRSK